MAESVPIYVVQRCRPDCPTGEVRIAFAAEADAIGYAKHHERKPENAGYVYQVVETLLYHKLVPVKRGG